MKRVTLKQVSAAAGVSVQTASHVLNTRFQNLYRAETREKVLEAAQLMGYRPNAAARSMLAQRSHLIGLVVPIAPSNWFFQLDMFEIMMGMNLRLANAGYVTSIIPIANLVDPHEASRAFREQLLDGVVSIGKIPPSLREVIEKIAPVRIWCDTDINEPAGCLRRDEVHAGRTAAEHVIAAGYRELIHVTYPEASFHYSLTDRLSGIQAVADRHGIACEVFRYQEPWGGGGGECLPGRLRKDVAVIAANAHFAQALVNQAAKSGLAAGRDFGLASCDHSRERATVFPNLSRVMMERSEMGERTADLMLNALAHEGSLPDSVLMRGEWFAGDTAPGPRQ